jgi:Fe-S-cluster-containing hydrogenase component 2
MIVEKDSCMYCGSCASVCPSNAIIVTDYDIQVTDECTDCKTCVQACPMGAIQ